MKAVTARVECIVSQSGDARSGLTVWTHVTGMNTGCLKEVQVELTAWATVDMG